MMPDVVIVSLIQAIGTLLSALLAALAAYWSKQNRKTIALLEKNTNSIKDALVKATGEAAFHRGVVVGTDAAKQGKEEST